MRLDGEVKFVFFRRPQSIGPQSSNHDRGKLGQTDTWSTYQTTVNTGAQWSSVLTVVPTVATGPQSEKSQSLSPSACDSSCSLIKLHIPHTPSSHQLGGARSTRRTRSSTIGSAAASSVRSARGRSRLRRRKEGAAEVHRRLGSARQTCRFLEPLQGECNTRPHSVH